MSIQSSINQAINLGGLLYTQTGGYKAKQEEIIKKKEITKAKEGAMKASDVAIGAMKGAIDPKAPQSAINIAVEAYKDSADAYKNLYKLNPTDENLTMATISREMADIAQGFQGISDKMHKTVPYDINKAKEANQKAVDRVNAMSEQKESARRYMMLLKEDKE